jgi:hypothetical protein
MIASLPNRCRLTVSATLLINAASGEVDAQSSRVRHSSFEGAMPFCARSNIVKIVLSNFIFSPSSIGIIERTLTALYAIS